MMNLICEDDELFPVYPEDLDLDMPRPLRSFLCGHDQMGPRKKILDFPKEYRITSDGMKALFTFLRSGNILGSLEDVVDVFAFFGGWEPIDKMFEEVQLIEGTRRHTEFLLEIQKYHAPPGTPTSDFKSEYEWDLKEKWTEPLPGFVRTGYSLGTHLWLRRPCGQESGSSE